MKSLLLILLCYFFILLTAHSQTATITSAETVIGTTRGPDSVYVSSENFTGMVEKTTYSAVMIINVSNPENIAEIIVGMGTQSGSDDIASGIFSAADIQASSADMEYARNGNEVRVYLGEFDIRPQGFAWARLRLANDTYTQITEDAIN